MIYVITYFSINDVFDYIAQEYVYMNIENYRNTIFLLHNLCKTHIT